MKKIGTIYDFGSFKKSLKEVMQNPSRNKGDLVSEVIRFETLNNKVSLTYTDTFRLTHKEIENSTNFNKDIKAHLSFPVIRELMKIKGFEQVEVFETEGGGLLFKANYLSIFENFVKFNDITYPDYKSVLNLGSGRIASFNIEVSAIHLLEVMKEAYKIASKRDGYSGKYAVKLEIDKDKMTIYTKAGLDEFKDTIPIINESGKRLEIGVNSKQLIDFLKLKIDEITTVNFEDYYSPVVINTSNGLTQIFMPLVWRGE